MKGNDILEKNISIIGGDLRIVNLAKMLSQDGFHVFAFGIEKAKEILKETSVEFVNSLKEVTEKSNTIVSSIPLSQDGITVTASYSDLKISLEDLHDTIRGKRFIAGKLNNSIKSDPSIDAYDILDIEEYAILNAIATAEGAIQIAMEEFPKTLHSSNILVMGFGRIGKIVAKMLQGIGANVYCEARKNEDLAYIKAYGYTPINLKNLDEKLHQFDIIINNIPVQILDKTRLDLLKKDVLIIDLASKPGGVDFEYAKVQNIKTIWALALPGKVAPLSAAEYIRDVLYSLETVNSGTEFTR